MLEETLTLLEDIFDFWYVCCKASCESKRDGSRLPCLATTADEGEYVVRTEETSEL